VPQIVCIAVADALSISELTGGAFDITVGPVVDLWGFGPEGSRSEPPEASMIAAARERVGYGRVAADCKRPALRKDRGDVRIDLSAYAKGFAVDRVAELLDAQGMTDYMVEIGGELRARGRSESGGPWRIAIESPTASGGHVQRIIEPGVAGMATSGDYRNYFEVGERRYSHTIDPRLGAPVSHDLAAVTVVDEKAAFADAMATALLVLGPGEGMRLAERQGLAVYFQQRAGAEVVEKMSSEFRRLTGPE
jgi:thiamine biosynthesis lipoprotein